uniref:diaminopimelate epimerase n=1 Tax=Paulinella chromatophora TaxID=39717 RepID=B1X3T5_PAUCH|nr:Diaminopimelate epimerase [Paulinella chromatophora]ACB42604.1 Diaminopimelate epimerase [Paulinella chromatophora]
MLQFSKYHGLGNDFLIIDGRSWPANFMFANPDPEWVRHLCDRHFGVGADGVIIILSPTLEGDWRMRIFNADGTEAQMCGNGIRCISKFLADSDKVMVGHKWKIETLAGIIVSELKENDMIYVDMGIPILSPHDIPTRLSVGQDNIAIGLIETNGITWSVAAAGMGNPHIVIPVKDAEDIDIEKFGPLLEEHFAFPTQTNVHFLQVIEHNHLKLRTWERGVGVTFACGTGACAALIVAHSLGLSDKEAQIDLPGGSLLVNWETIDNHISIIGSAKAIFDGVLTPELTPIVSEVAQTFNEIEKVEMVEENIPTFEKVLCTIVCVNGCLHPDNCPSLKARINVSDFLNKHSLDEMLALANDSIESRLRAKSETDAQTSI